MILILYYQPFKEKDQNKNEIFNELCVLLITYILILFNNPEIDIDTKYYIGWIYIAIIVSNIGFNAFKLLYSLLFEIIPDKIKEIIKYFKERKL